MHTTGVICVELVRKLQDAGARFTEVGVHHYRRVHGKSEFFRVGAIARTLWGLAGLWMQMVVLRRGRRPVGRSAGSEQAATDVPTGRSWWASQRALGRGQRREHPVERAPVDVGRRAGSTSRRRRQPVERAERGGRRREERVRVRRALDGEPGRGGELGERRAAVAAPAVDGRVVRAARARRRPVPRAGARRPVVMTRASSRERRAVVGHACRAW